MENDEKYNLILKYAHKIRDKESFSALKKLIDNDSAVLIEKGLNLQCNIYF